MDKQRIANDLLVPIWRSIPDRFKFKDSCWEEFGILIRQAARWNISFFLLKITESLDIKVPERSAAAARAIMASGEDQEAILRSLREETTLYILLVRVDDDMRQIKRELTQN